MPWFGENDMTAALPGDFPPGFPNVSATSRGRRPDAVLFYPNTPAKSIAQLAGRPRLDFVAR
jgi:hypothetical protein